MNKTVVAIGASVVCLGVPALMAVENWDDHDRSNRYAARDFGYNYLASTEENAIIFSNGDNDTFPLWYNQEVEGQRTDVRVCNLSYLQTDWYIDQMKREAYESAPLPISWKLKDYITGTNEVINIRDVGRGPVDIQTAFAIALDPDIKVDGENIIPSKQLYLDVDPQQVIKSGTMDVSRIDSILTRININLTKTRLTKSELMVLEMIKENNWERPMYFATTIGDEFHLGMTDNLELTGMAYQILPVSNGGTGQPGVNVDKAYDNMMNKFRWGNVADPNVYLDETVMRMCRTHRMMFTQLVTALVAQGDTVRAMKALDFSLEVLPGTTIRHDYTSSLLAEQYFAIGAFEKGLDIMQMVATDCVENLTWYFRLTNAQRRSVEGRIGHNFAVLNHVLSIADKYGQNDFVNAFMPAFQQFSQRVRM